MMSQLIALCSESNIASIYRVLSVVKGICCVIEVVPDNDIVLAGWTFSLDWSRGCPLYRRSGCVFENRLVSSSSTAAHCLKYLLESIANR